MHRHDDFRPLRHDRRQLIGSEQPILPDVGEHNAGAKISANLAAGGECVGGDDNLVPDTNPERLERKMQRSRGRVDRECVGNA